MSDQEQATSQPWLDELARTLEACITSGSALGKET